MQGEKSIPDSAHVIEQGTAATNTSIDPTNSWNNSLDPVESQPSNYMLSPDVARFHDFQGTGGWQLGESSTSRNQQIHVKDDNAKAENSWLSPFQPRDRAGASLDDMDTEPANILLLHESADIGLHNNQFFPENSHMPQNVNLDSGCIEYGQTLRPSEHPNLNNPDALENVNVLSANVFLNGVETSTSLCNLSENDGASCSSSSWGLSCKRKALEGTSSQAYSVGSSTCFPQSENLWHPVPSRFSTSGALTISTPPVNIPVSNSTDSINTRNMPGRMLPFDTYPPCLSENNVSSFGSSNRRTNLEHQLETVSPDTLFAGRTRRPNISSSHILSRSLSITDHSEVRSMPTTLASINSLPHQSRVMHVPGSSRHARPFSHNMTPHIRVGSSLASLILPEHEMQSSAGPVLHGENLRHFRRNNVEHHIFIPASEAGYFGHDPTARRLSAGDVSIPSGGVIPPSRRGSGSTFHALGSTMWLPNNNVPSMPLQRLERLVEFPPWAMVMPASSDPVGGHGPYSSLSSGPSTSSQATLLSHGSASQGRRSAFPRTGSVAERRRDVPRGSSHPLRSLAIESEGRQRLMTEIRQVLIAMRGQAQSQAEEYMLFEPIMFHEMADLYDRHRDMRLDVDNMTYEELLALEERIGDVKTGLSEEAILNTMKQRKLSIHSEQDLEPCCICREEYADGDDVGTLLCSHDFHLDCIKQWLLQKNLCPICKTTALNML